MSILQQLSIRNSQRAKEFPDYEKFIKADSAYFGCALAGEVGEACNVVKKMERGELLTRGGSSRSLLMDELADVLIQLDLLAQVSYINLEEALIRKFNSKSMEIGSSVFLRK